MDALASISPTTLAAVAGAVVVLLALVAVARMIRRGQGGADAAHDKRVRALVASGDFANAAKLQLGAGRKLEAFNLLARGNVHDEASVLAEELGMFAKAADHAEHAGAFARAADLYHRADDFANAGRLYQRSGHFRQAAEAMERDPNIAVETLARMWENACLDLMPAQAAPQSLPPDRLSEVMRCAERAADAYKKAGDNTKAAAFYDICQKPDDADALRNRSTQALIGKMTQAHGAHGTLTHPVDLSGVEGGEQLGALRSLVHEVVRATVASSAAQPTTTAVVHVDRLPDNVSVVYVRDSNTDQDTPIARESDRYSIEEKLGEGGMAVVYRAQDTVLDRPVAMKFLPEGLTSNPSSLSLFEREAKVAANIVHPNVVTIFDFGLMQGRPFICMELINGHSLEDRLQECASQGDVGLPMLEVLASAEGLFTALEAAHRAGMVHRDIKPSNVMVTDGDLIKLMDFGIASAIDPKKSTMIVGTPVYMAPEQFEGKGIDHRCDLFAAGVMLYELLTGKLPYAALDRSKLPEHRPRKLRDDTPRALDDIVWQCIQLRADDRPSSATDLLQVIRPLLANLRRDAHAAPPAQRPDALLPSDRDPSPSATGATLDLGAPLPSDDTPAPSAASSSDAFAYPLRGTPGGRQPGASAAPAAPAPAPAFELISHRHDDTPDPDGLAAFFDDAEALSSPPASSDSPSISHDDHTAAIDLTAQRGSIASFFDNAQDLALPDAPAHASPPSSSHDDDHTAAIDLKHTQHGHLAAFFGGTPHHPAAPHAPPPHDDDDRTAAIDTQAIQGSVASFFNTARPRPEPSTAPRNDAQTSPKPAPAPTRKRPPLPQPDPNLDRALQAYLADAGTPPDASPDGGFDVDRALQDYLTDGAPLAAADKNPAAGVNPSRAKRPRKAPPKHLQPARNVGKNTDDDIQSMLSDYLGPKDR